jgi:hypothetical protein
LAGTAKKRGCNFKDTWIVHHARKSISFDNMERMDRYMRGNDKCKAAIACSRVVHAPATHKILVLIPVLMSGMDVSYKVAIVQDGDALISLGW